MVPAEFWILLQLLLETIQRIFPEVTKFVYSEAKRQRNLQTAFTFQTRQEQLRPAERYRKPDGEWEIRGVRGGAAQKAPENYFLRRGMFHPTARTAAGRG